MPQPPARRFPAVAAPLGAVLAFGLAMGLVGCGSSPPRTNDLVTASDQTDADRRAKVLLELASAYFGRGAKTTALDEVKKALVAKPNMVEAHNLRGLIYASMDEYQLAEESFQRALQINARDPDVRHNYGWFLCQRRRFPEADAQFLAAQAVPNYAGVNRSLLAQGVCQARAGQWPEAERTLGRAYELEPGNPAIALNLSEVLYRRGEFERARFYIRRINGQAEQSNAQTLWLAARIEHRLGQVQQRNALGSELKIRFPQSPEALLFERGRFDE